MAGEARGRRRVGGKEKSSQCLNLPPLPWREERGEPGPAVRRGGRRASPRAGDAENTGARTRVKGGRGRSRFPYYNRRSGGVGAAPSVFLLFSRAFSWDAFSRALSCGGLLPLLPAPTMGVARAMPDPPSGLPALREALAALFYVSKSKQPPTCFSQQNRRAPLSPNAIFFLPLHSQARLQPAQDGRPEAGPLPQFPGGGESAGAGRRQGDPQVRRER